MRRAATLMTMILLAACGGHKTGVPDMSAGHGRDMSLGGAAGDMSAPGDLAVGPDLLTPPDLWIPGTCFDGKLDQNETDVDCGGVCGRRCTPGQKCAVDDDCLDRTCGADKTCTQVCPMVSTNAPSVVCPGGTALNFGGGGFLPGAFMYINNTTSIAARVEVMSASQAKGVWGTLTSGGPYDARITDPARTCFSQLGSTFMVANTGPSSFVSDTPLVWNGITTPLHISVANLTPTIVSVTYGNVPMVAGNLTIASQSTGGAFLTVANGAAPDTYDLVLTDSNLTCSRAIDPNALTIIGGSPTVTLAVTPTSGSNAAGVALDITAANAMFSPDVQVYLAPHGSPATAATRATGFHLVDATHVQATVPAAIATGMYDVITVGAANGGTVGRSSGVYTAN